MMREILALLLVFALASPAYAGGGLYNTHHEFMETCAINYKDGVEDMLISVEIDLTSGGGVVWILPIQADPEEIQIDIVKEFPDLKGYEVKSRLGYSMHQSFPFMILSQVYPAPLLWQFGMLGRNDTTQGVKEDSLFSIYRHVKRTGLISEIVTAKDMGEFEKLDEKSLKVYDEYIAKNYSFVVSWISNPDEYHKLLLTDFISVRVRFPTEDIYYPLQLTPSDYLALNGELRELPIPIRIFVIGHVTPEFYEEIKENSSFDYYISENYPIPSELESFFNANGVIDRLHYTKIEINSKSSNFSEDLYIENSTPPEIIFADIMHTHWLLLPVLVFILSSCIASGVAGLQFRKEVPISRLFLLGLSNFLTIIGFSWAVIHFLKLSGDEKEIPNKEKTGGQRHPSINMRKAKYVVRFSIAFLIVTFLLSQMIMAIYPLAVKGDVNIAYSRPVMDEDMNNTEEGMNTTIGLGKIKPVGRIKYTGHTLTFSIMNDVGQEISGANISKIYGDCMDHEAGPKLLSIDGVMSSGEVSTETLECNTKYIGKPFYVYVRISYVVNVNGQDILRTENLTISGITE